MFIKATAIWKDGTKVESTFHKEAERIMWQVDVAEQSKKNRWGKPRFEVHREERVWTFAEAAENAAKFALGDTPAAEATEKLHDLEAEITHLGSVFSTSERKTDVATSMVYINIPAKQTESTIYTRMKKAADAEDAEVVVEDLTVTDYLEMIVRQYDVEAAAGCELIREYHAMRPYLLCSAKQDDHTNKKTILTLTVGNDSNYSQKCSSNEYVG